LCRTDRYLPPGIKSKIALFCDVEEEAVITAKDVETVYEVPLVFHRQASTASSSSCSPRAPVHGSHAVGRRGQACDVTAARDADRRGGEVHRAEGLLQELDRGAHPRGIANDSRVDVSWVDAEHIERDGPAAHFADVHGSSCPAVR